MPGDGGLASAPPQEPSDVRCPALGVSGLRTRLNVVPCAGPLRTAPQRRRPQPPPPRRSPPAPPRPDGAPGFGRPHAEAASLHPVSLVGASPQNPAESAGRPAFPSAAPDQSKALPRFRESTLHGEVGGFGDQLAFGSQQRADTPKRQIFGEGGKT